MRKKELEELVLPDPPEEMIRTAQNDRYRKRHVGLPDAGWDVTSYGTSLYFSADKAEEKIVVQMWTRQDLAMGNYEPRAVTYVDPENHKWISKMDGKWTEALIENVANEYANQARTHWTAEYVSMKEQTEECAGLLESSGKNVYEVVSNWQHAIRDMANRQRALKRKESWDRKMSMLPPPPPGFREWVKTEGTKEDNFIFYRKRGEKTEAFCTYCGTLYETSEKMQHNAGNPNWWNHKKTKMSACRSCGTVSETKAWGMQKTISVWTNVVLPQVAGNTISMREYKVRKVFKPALSGAWECEMSMAETWRLLVDPQTFRTVESYTKEAVAQLNGCVCWRSKNFHNYYGEEQKYEIYSGVMYLENADEICEAARLPKALYTHCKGGKTTSPQRQLIVAARKRYIEYLIRAGLSRMADEVIAAGSTSIKLKEDAKTLKDLLDVDGEQLRILKDLDGTILMRDVLNEVKWRKEKLDVGTLKTMDKERITVSDLRVDETGLTIQRAMNYIVKQAQKEGRGIKAVCEEYGDYLDIAKRTCRDITDEIISRTPNLKEMHDRYVQDWNANKNSYREISANRVFNRIAADFEKNQNHFRYERSGLVVIVPTRASDIIKEGQRQHHCVGASDRYMKDMNDGESFILFLRKKEDPENPYYTLEVAWNGDVRQWYGAYDRKPDKEKVGEWLQGFRREIKKRTDKEANQKAVAV